MVQAVFQATGIALIVLFIATAVALVRKYAVRQDRGLLWLGGALVVWPLISRLLSYGMVYGVDTCRLPAGCANLFPFSLVVQNNITLGELVALHQYIDHIVGASLVLVAVTQLYRNIHRNGSTPQPVPATNRTSQNQKDDKNKPFATAA